MITLLNIARPGIHEYVRYLCFNFCSGKTIYMPFVRGSPSRGPKWGDLCFGMAC